MSMVQRMLRVYSIILSYVSTKSNKLLRVTFPKSHVLIFYSDRSIIPRTVASYVLRCSVSSTHSSQSQH